ncbi:hypothetical protein ACMFMG_012082 [Clarireedia jacksonii]
MIPSPNGIRAFSSFMIFLSTTATALRFWSRAIISKPTPFTPRFWWDDWFALVDLPFVVANSCISIVWVHYGLGQHSAILSAHDQALTWKFLYYEYPTYDLGITFSKLSVLFFYVRVFKVNARFRKALWLTGALVVAWALFSVFATLLRCSPARKSWLPDTPGYCMDLYKLWLGNSVASLVVDVIILLLPVPILLQLQSRMARKISIILVFVCGYA